MYDENNKPLPTGPERKRGRPRGHNRISLNEEERRARNALYEKERRIKQAEATADLMQALGCEGKIKLAEVLALTIMRIKREQAGPSIQQMQADNTAIEAEIAQLESILASESEESARSTTSDEEPLASSRSSYTDSGRSDSSLSMRQVDEEASTSYEDCHMDWQSYVSHSAVYTDEGCNVAARCRPYTSVRKIKRNQDEEPSSNCQSTKRLKQRSDDRSSSAPRPSTSFDVFGGFFNTFQFLTMPKDIAATSENETVTSPEHESVTSPERESVTSPECDSNMSTLESSSTASPTVAEEADLLLGPEEVKTLESLLAEDGFTDGIPLWSSPEDIDFDIFPPT